MRMTEHQGRIGRVSAFHGGFEYVQEAPDNGGRRACLKGLTEVDKRDGSVTNFRRRTGDWLLSSQPVGAAGAGPEHCPARDRHLMIRTWAPPHTLVPAKSWA